MNELREATIDCRGQRLSNARKQEISVFIHRNLACSLTVVTYLGGATINTVSLLQLTRFTFPVRVYNYRNTVTALALEIWRCYRRETAYPMNSVSLTHAVIETESPA